MELNPIKAGSTPPTSAYEEIHAHALSYYTLLGYTESWIFYYLQDNSVK